MNILEKSVIIAEAVRLCVSLGCGLDGCFPEWIMGKYCIMLAELT